MKSHPLNLPNPEPNHPESNNPNPTNINIKNGREKKEALEETEEELFKKSDAF